MDGQNLYSDLVSAIGVFPGFDNGRTLLQSRSYFMVSSPTEPCFRQLSAGKVRGRKSVRLREKRMR